MEKTTAASILNDRNKIDQLTQYLVLSLEAHKQVVFLSLLLSNPFLRETQSSSIRSLKSF